MKETFEDIRTDPNGNLILHGHLETIDLFNEGCNESINGARIKKESLKISLTRISDTINSDGYNIGQWKMIFRQGYRMSEVFDRLPYGIIDKTITGLGATTLELYTEVRNSIIVVPTKALAYNKHKVANLKKKETFCLYVGSAIGEIKKDTNIEMIQKYLASRTNKVKKFLAVADSLPKLLDYLLESGEDVFNNYFLMVDEIDTMQDDSAYRPKLEVVIDNYFRFKYSFRAAVSATIRKFSDPRLNNEARLRLEWEKQPVRYISTIHTNYVDDIAWKIINELLCKDNNKILVAYNSLDGILNIIKHLNISSNDCGILCSERSVNKIKDLINEPSDAIDARGKLRRRVTFMTCAYFAGIDIVDKCHLLSISTRLQPFTYLSPNKLTQIAGRLRNGSLSETIVYDTSLEKTQSISPNLYNDEVITLANKYSDFLNTTIDLTAKDTSLLPLRDFLFSFTDFAKRRKPTYTSYPLNIVRQESLKNRFVPAYLNIDALIETYKLKTILYKDKNRLVRTLEKAGHKVSSHIDIYLQENNHDSSAIYDIKAFNKAKLDEEFDYLAEVLIEWHLQGRNPNRLKEIRRNTNKRLQDNVIKNFELFSEYIDCDELLAGLKDCYYHDRKLRNYINAVAYHILPTTHPFKAALSFSYGIDTKGFTSKVYFNMKQRHEVLRDLLISVCKYDFSLSPSVLSDLLNSFFVWVRSSKGDKVKGINPFGLSNPIKTLSNQTNIIDLLVFPR